MDIKAFMMEHEEFSFRELLWNNPSKIAVIVTFLVVLDLLRPDLLRLSRNARRMIYS